MRIHNKSTLVYILISYLLLCTITGYTDIAQASPKPIKPDYENVDVFVECDWGENDNMVQVTVFDKTKAENPYLIIIRKNGMHQEILLIKGIIVRIFDHDTDKLLKTYFGEN